MRPVVRLPAASAGGPPTEWVFTGGGPDATLTLDGLLVSGGDIVLRGAFAGVRLTACTADPGTLQATGAALDVSVDGRPLAPVRIWIEADPAAPPGTAAAIQQLTVDHCVLGPVRTRNGGAVETVTLSDSIVQGIAPSGAPTVLATADVYDPELLARGLGSTAPLSHAIFAMLPSAVQQDISSYTGGPLPDATLTAIVEGLNAIISGAASIDSPLFDDIPLAPDVAALRAEGGASRSLGISSSTLVEGSVLYLAVADMSP
jgi:hypothetical protein